MRQKQILVFELYFSSVPEIVALINSNEYPTAEDKFKNVRVCINVYMCTYTIDFDIYKYVWCEKHLPLNSR